MENSYAKIYFINFSDFSIEYISKKIMIFSEKKKKKKQYWVREICETIQNCTLL